MPRPASWDICEAAILLDAYLKVEHGELAQTKAITLVSKTLRDRAIASGKTIDDVFRNTNGINYQFQSLRYVMTEGRQGLPHASQLFRDIVDIYRKKPDEFARILEEARSGITATRGSSEKKPVKNAGGETSSINTGECHAANCPDTAQIEEPVSVAGQTQIPNTISRTNSDAFLDYLEARGIEFIDKRDKGGCLWIVGGSELEDLDILSKRQGIVLNYSKAGGRTTKGRSAWWTKQNTNRFKIPTEQGAQTGRLAYPILTNSSSSTLESRTKSKSCKVRCAGNSPAESYKNNSTGFRQWLIDQGVEDAEAKGLPFAIAIVGSLAKEYGIDSGGLYGRENALVLSELIEQLSRRKDFIRRDKERDNQLSNALRRYLEFVETITGGPQAERNGLNGNNLKTPAAQQDSLLPRTSPQVDNTESINASSSKPKQSDKLRTVTTSSSLESNSEAKEVSNDFETFLSWMMHKGISANRARKMSSEILIINNFAKSHGFSKVSFYGNSDYNKLIKLLQALYYSPAFKRRNDELDDCLRPVLGKYISFIHDLQEAPNIISWEIIQPTESVVAPKVPAKASASATRGHSRLDERQPKTRSAKQPYPLAKDYSSLPSGMRENLRELAIAILDIAMIDTEYSTNYFYDALPDLQKKLNIGTKKRFNEIVKLAFKGCQEVSFSSSGYFVQFGKCDRNRQILDLMKEMSPVSAISLRKEYENRYGVSQSTLYGWFYCIRKYRKGDTYSIEYGPKPLESRGPKLISNTKSKEPQGGTTSVYNGQKSQSSDTLKPKTAVEWMTSLQGRKRQIVQQTLFGKPISYIAADASLTLQETIDLLIAAIKECPTVREDSFLADFQQSRSKWEFCNNTGEPEATYQFLSWRDKAQPEQRIELPASNKAGEPPESNTQNLPSIDLPDKGEESTPQEQNTGITEARRLHQPTRQARLKLFTPTERKGGVPQTAEYADFLRNELKADCCDRRLIAERFRARFPEGPADPFDARTLRQLGFKTRGKKLLFREGVNYIDYFEELIDSKDMFARGDTGFENAVFNDPQFRKILRNRMRTYKVVEYERDSFISTDRLCNQMDVSLENIQNYSQDIVAQLRESYGTHVPFTVWSLRNRYGIHHPLDTLQTEGGMSDYIFETLFDIDQKVQCCTLAKKRGFLETDGRFDTGNFIECLIEMNGPMEIDDLVDLLRGAFGIDYPELPLHHTISTTSLYYDDITDSVYNSRREWEEMVNREFA